MALSRRRFPALLAALVATLCACAGGGQNVTTSTAAARSSVPVTSATSQPSRAPRTWRVPDDRATIQAAVDATRPGDLVLIAPGTYREAVVVNTEQVVLRGEDRNTVILDGGDSLDNGILVQADGVAVENLTVQRYTTNGVLFTKAFLDAGPGADHAVLVGYRASYVTVANNGLYGVYAFFAQNGVFENVYASGHPDSGIYIGQCKPCHALVTDSVAENNAVGYEGTNASTDIVITRSVFRENRVGLTVNTQKSEKLAPQQDVTIVGNWVLRNNNPNTPASEGAFGLGIAVGGGEGNVVTRNRVEGNRGVGILVTDLDGFIPSANRVDANSLSGNGTDLAYYDSTQPPGQTLTRGNCFRGNSFATSSPPALDTTLGCGAAEPAATIAAPPPRQVAPPQSVDYRTLPLPGPQPQMPAGPGAPVQPAIGLPPRTDVEAISVPSAEPAP